VRWLKMRLGALLVLAFYVFPPAQAFTAHDRAEAEARVRADSPKIRFLRQAQALS
jgi:hypothetical protein